MSILRFTTLASLFVLALGGATPVDGGSPRPYPLLGAVTKVDLMVSGPSGFEPIPGLDRKALDQEMRNLSIEAIRLAGLELAEPEEASILVTVRHAWHGQERDLVALLITLEVHVLAQPVDLTSQRLMFGRPTLRLWSDEYLELGPTAEAREIILEALDAGLERLLQARQSAQAWAAEESTKEGFFEPFTEARAGNSLMEMH